MYLKQQGRKASQPTTTESPELTYLREVSAASKFNVAQIEEESQYTRSTLPVDLVFDKIVMRPVELAVLVSEHLQVLAVTSRNLHHL